MVRLRQAEPLQPAEALGGPGRRLVLDDAPAGVHSGDGLEEPAGAMSALAEAKDATTLFI